MSSLTRFVQQVIPFTISSHHIGQVIFVSEVILFSCLITVLICIKNPLLFDPCISISNKLILVFSYIAFCVYCFYVISMFHFYCTVIYVDVRLSHPNKDYLLTYLLTYLLFYKLSGYVVKLIGHGSLPVTRCPL